MKDKKTILPLVSISSLATLLFFGVFAMVSVSCKKQAIDQNRTGEINNGSSVSALNYQPVQNNGTYLFELGLSLGYPGGDRTKLPNCSPHVARLCWFIRWTSGDLTPIEGRLQGSVERRGEDLGISFRKDKIHPQDMKNSFSGNNWAVDKPFTITMIDNTQPGLVSTYTVGTGDYQIFETDKDFYIWFHH